MSVNHGFDQLQHLGFHLQACGGQLFVFGLLHLTGIISVLSGWLWLLDDRYRRVEVVELLPPWWQLASAHKPGVSPP